jgi:hypothetical protein
MALVAKISGLGQYCTRHSNGGAGSVMSSSFDNPGDFRGSVLSQESPVNNAGQLAGTIIKNVYQGIAGRTVSEPDLLAAEELLSRLPEAAVPAPATLPARSWMRAPRNPLFVGRHGDLLALARIVKLGEVAAVGRLQRRPGWAVSARPSSPPSLCIATANSSLAVCAGSTSPRRPTWQARLHGAVVRTDCRSTTIMPRCRSRSRSHWCWPPGAVAATPAGLRQLRGADIAAAVAAAAWRRRVLLTSRRAEWPSTLGVQAVALGILAPDESVALLRKHRPDLRPDDAALVAITAELGHLPLALHLAGSYLERYRYDPEGQPATYLAELRRPDLLSHGSLTAGDHSPTGHELHVANTFALSHGRLEPADPTDALARAALLRAAYFAFGEPIPRDPGRHREHGYIALREAQHLQPQRQTAIVQHRQADARGPQQGARHDEDRVASGLQADRRRSWRGDADHRIDLSGQAPGARTTGFDP